MRSYGMLVSNRNESAVRAEPDATKFKQIS
jgi:hypothetical protein